MQNAIRLLVTIAPRTSHRLWVRQGIEAGIPAAPMAMHLVKARKFTHTNPSISGLVLLVKRRSSAEDPRSHAVPRHLTEVDRVGMWSAAGQKSGGR